MKKPSQYSDQNEQNNNNAITESDDVQSPNLHLLNLSKNKKSIHFKNEMNNQDDINSSNNNINNNKYNGSQLSLHAGNSSQVSKSGLDIEIDNNNFTPNNVSYNSPSASLRSITLKMNPSQIKEDSKKDQKESYKIDSNQNTPSSHQAILMNPNLAHIHRQQFLKKQTHWSEEIDVFKYKPHQLHQKIDLINPFDQNLENKDAVELLKCILSKQPQKRNSKEIQFVRKCLKNVKFFSDIENNLPEELILRLCKFLNYERYPQFHRLYRAGDFGRKFYIILDGAVFILTPSINKTFDQNSSDNKEDKQIKQMIMHEFEETPKFFPSPVINFEDAVDEAQFISQIVSAQNEGFNIKKTLEQGDGFGEIALRTEGIRTASVVCKEDSHFVSITSSTYQEVLDSYHDLLYKEKIDFLKNVSIFKKWSLAFIHEIMMQINIKQYKRGDVLYEEGERSKNLYFVRSGEVELQQVVEIKDEKQSLKFIPDKLLKSNVIWNEKIKNAKLKKCSLVILGPYQYFGDYEIFKKSKRITRAVCYSNTELFILEKKEFFENMQFINMVKEIHNLFKEREIWYQNIIKKNINTDAQILKKITSQKQLQTPHFTDLNDEKNKSRRLSHRQELTSTNNISQSSYSQININNDKSKYQKVSIENSQPSIADDLNQYQSNSFLNKINIYKDVKSPKNQLEDQELFLDQIKIRNKLQQQKKRYQEDQEEQAIDNVIKLKQFVGKSMNLIKQIESAKNLPTISDQQQYQHQQQHQRRSEETIQTSLYQLDPQLGSNGGVGVGGSTSLHKLEEIIPQNGQNNLEQKYQKNILSPSSSNRLQIQHSPSKSVLNLSLVKDKTPLNNNNNNNHTLNSSTKLHKSILDSTHTSPSLLNHLISPTNLHNHKNIINSFKKQSQNDNYSVKINHNNNNNVNNPNSNQFNNNNNGNNNNNNQYQNGTQNKQQNNHHPISSQLDLKEKNYYQQYQRGSLEDIESLAQELTKYAKQAKSIQSQDDNFAFIKSQIDANRKKLKMEQVFTHKYLCEKTGRYKMPSIQHLSEVEREQYNGQTSVSMKDFTDRNHYNNNQNNNFNSPQVNKPNPSLIHIQSNDKPDLKIDSNNYNSNDNQYNNKQFNENRNLSLPIIVSPKLMNKEINFSKSYKKGKKKRLSFLESQQKRTLKLC